jgi:hypothetical protein
MDYLYDKVENATFDQNTALRALLRDHLVLVAKALRSIEWNDSGDGDDDEDENIKTVLGISKTALGIRPPVHSMSVFTRKRRK